MANLKNSRHIAAATASFNSGPSIGIAGQGDYALPSSASGATSGDVLTFTNAGLQWTALPGGSISSLSGVNIAAPSTGQVLKYDGTNWINGTDDIGSGGGGATTLDGLTDVNTGIGGEPSIGEVLMFKSTVGGGEWQNTALSLGAYTPAENTHWIEPAPTTVADALDRMAAWVFGYTGSAGL